jgi:hypothetical protein
MPAARGRLAAPFGTKFLRDAVHVQICAHVPTLSWTGRSTLNLAGFCLDKLGHLDGNTDERYRSANRDDDASRGSSSDGHPGDSDSKRTKINGNSIHSITS